MLIHDRSLRLTRKLAVVESLIRGGAGLVRAANIGTSTGCTNPPITKLCPLKVCTHVEVPPREDDTGEQAIRVPSRTQNTHRRTKVKERSNAKNSWL